MKYNLSLNARNFYKQTKQDIYNCWVLDYLRDICVSQCPDIIEKRIVEDSLTWTWVDYGHLLSEIPYLTRITSKSSISKIIKELKESGYIDFKRSVKNRVYVRILQKTDSLIFSSKLNFEDNSIKKIEAKKTIRSESEKEGAQKIFDVYTQKILPGSRLTSNAKKKISARLKEFTLEEILQGIDNFSKDSWWMENNAKRGITWFFHSEDRTEQFKNLIPRASQPDKEVLRRGTYNTSNLPLTKTDLSEKIK